MLLYAAIIKQSYAAIIKLFSAAALFFRFFFKVILKKAVIFHAFSLY